MEYRRILCKKAFKWDAYCTLFRFWEGALQTNTPGQRPALKRDPRTETIWTETPLERPLDKDPLDREPSLGQKSPRRNMGLGTETPRWNMGLGSQKRSEFIQRPLVDRMTDMCKALPCPKHHLHAVQMHKYFVTQTDGRTDRETDT